MAYIEFEDVKKIYGTGEAQVRALDGVSFQVEKGEFVVLLGSSGAGKTTLLNMLGGMDTITEGKILFDGRDISHMSGFEMARYRRHDVGFVFQFYNLMPELTAYQNILLPMQLDNRKVDKAYLDEVISLLGLGDRLSHYAGELSGGQQQRVAIARALITQPAVLLADEPTGNLDGKSGAEVLELLHLSRKRFNQTLIMVTHDRQIAEGADRIITLEDGCVVGDTRRNG